MNIDALFGNMAKADINGSGTYMGEGLYVVEIKTIFVKEGRNPAKPGDSFICEFTVLESSNANHAPGSSGSYVLKFSNPYTLGNIAELVIALLGYENSKENQKNSDIREQADVVVRATCGSDKGKAELAELRAALGEDYGTLTGKKLRLECVKKPTLPKNGKPAGEFTVHKWSPLNS